MPSFAALQDQLRLQLRTGFSPSSKMVAASPTTNPNWFEMGCKDTEARQKFSHKPSPMYGLLVSSHSGPSPDCSLLSSYSHFYALNFNLYQNKPPQWPSLNKKRQGSDGYNTAKTPIRLRKIGSWYNKPSSLTKSNRFPGWSSRPTED